MQRTSIALLRAGLSIAALCCATLGVVDQAIAQTPAPSAIEIEFWRSAERVATPEAYRAYLAAFPNGAFANLARAGLPAPNGPAAAAPPSATPPEVKASPSLRYFSETAPNTGSITFNLGDRFVGPGPLTVGSIGAKKQVILPPGEWVLLAASDSKSVQAGGFGSPNTVYLTTLVFSKFAGERVQSMLRFTSNYRPAAVRAWSDQNGCNLAEGPALHFERSAPTSFSEECFAIRLSPTPMANTSAAMDEARRSLERLGAKASGVAMATILTFGEWRRYGYLGVTRLDWPALALGADADNPRTWGRETLDASPAHSAYVKGLTAWAQAYRAHAREGHWNTFDAPALLASAPVPSASANGPKVIEFDPAASPGSVPK